MPIGITLGFNNHFGIQAFTFTKVIKLNCPPGIRNYLQNESSILMFFPKGGGVERYNYTVGFS